MIYYIKYDLQTVCRQLIENLLLNSGLNYNLPNNNELEVEECVSENMLNRLNLKLNTAGVEILASSKIILIQKIKEAITELINSDDEEIISKTSYHLSKKLNCSYRYLATIFTEVTYTTIENYVIIQKIEKAKDMISLGVFTFSEIAWKLNYSSIAHFSMQFKNTIGLTPTVFKKIITKKRNFLTS